mmetsp:Transcript_2661/g.11057  ORF Transcript_2661/g.11057 Transcript_2661/m.11057 type:complete len:85 (-) Transcript_2661:196-450(-)
MQEFSSAKAAVESAAQAAGVEVQISADRVNEYPIFVRVTAFMDDGETATVWEGRQQALFRKNGATRTRSIQEIRDGMLEILKQE